MRQVMFTFYRKANIPYIQKFQNCVKVFTNNSVKIPKRYCIL